MRYVYIVCVLSRYSPPADVYTYKGVGTGGGHGTSAWTIFHRAKLRRRYFIPPVEDRGSPSSFFYVPVGRPAGGRGTIYPLPVPLSGPGRADNPFGLSFHSRSCVYARLGLI